MPLNKWGTRYTHLLLPPFISFLPPRILEWVTSCEGKCLPTWAVPLQSTSIESPNADEELTVPPEYSNLPLVFSPKRSTQLPSPHEWDCTFTLKEGAVPPRCRVYPRSQEEEKTMGQFIRSFSMLARPLTDLLRGTAKKLRWNSEAERAFEELKTAFSTAPVLQQPDPKRPFVVEVDALDVGVGAALSQHKGKLGQLKPIAYFLKKLSPAEKNYGVGHRELLAIKLALEEWRHWLEGARHPFKVYTDHKNSEYLQATKRLNSRQARWSLFFFRFNFHVTYRPGEKNVRADALSWQHHTEAQSTSQEPVLSPSCFLVMLKWDLDREIKAANPNPHSPPNRFFVPPKNRRALIT
ncbi:hypothetical protein P4O66_003995 [Electrophorus voltai]|uniref:Reverse transcriptase/retrotransposon-derived protein RNase H-like domain-containing protein n=1 Tax=Electrophorus voltai TaxID=2609070 RepID=A0AAD8YN08_9TELE|nr:hypothetical protein P4O66_003995 [Electrophorus voltai]